MNKTTILIATIGLIIGLLTFAVFSAWAQNSSDNTWSITQTKRSNLNSEIYLLKNKIVKEFELERVAVFRGESAANTNITYFINVNNQRIALVLENKNGSAVKIELPDNKFLMLIDDAETGKINYLTIVDSESNEIDGLKRAVDGTYKAIEGDEINEIKNGMDIFAK